MNTIKIFMDKLQDIDEKISQAKIDCETKKAELEAKIVEVEQKRDREIEKLRIDRDAIVMKEKLKDYPAALVENHKTCSMCGAEMRPFTYVEGEQVVKAWACQVGSLSAAHDLVRV